MRKNTPYFKHKINLFFDANFPYSVVESLKKSSVCGSARLISAYDAGLQRRDDPFYFNFCRKRGYSLVTLDDDFMNDRKYPFSKIPGIIRIVSSKNKTSEIEQLLKIFIEFVKHIPLPRIFLGDSKFQISTGGCIMRARDAKSGEIKTIEIIPDETTDLDVRNFFHYFV